MEPREVLVEIYNEIKETKDCLYLAQKALIYNSLRPLNIAEEVMKEMHQKGVSFSDEAMSALNFLIEKIIELLNNTADLVLAKNTVIYGYVKATKNAIAMSTDDYEKRQEKQSAGDKGKAKSLKLFITILDSLKAITTHTGTIAEELFK
jgi:Na+/phosphate symporter